MVLIGLWISVCRTITFDSERHLLVSGSLILWYWDGMFFKINKCSQCPKKFYVSPWSSHIRGPQKCKNFGPGWFGSRDMAKKPFSDHFWTIFWVFSKPYTIQMVIAIRLIFWPMIELKTRFDLSHQLVPYLATRRLSANCCENLLAQIRPCSRVLQNFFIKSKTSRITYIFW